MNRDHLMIGVPSWIINDGNLPDFKRGTEASFAVQFYAPSPLDVTDSGHPRLESLDRNRYRALSKVSHMFSDWWIIQNDDVYFLSQQRPPIGVRPGGFVKGEILLSIDPYFYVEQLSRRHDAPALIYNWMIEKIEIQTAPYIEVGKGRVRDSSRLGWREIDATEAAIDDGGLAEYVLHCGRADYTPRHQFNKTEANSS